MRRVASEYFHCIGLAFAGKGNATEDAPPENPEPPGCGPIPIDEAVAIAKQIMDVPGGSTRARNSVSSVAALRLLDALRRNQWLLSVRMTAGIHRNADW